MLKKFFFTAFVTLLVAGCASVPMEPQEASDQAKRFETPAEGNAAIYVYRDSFVGKALKKDLWINDECLGRSAPDVFFYKQLPGDQEYTIATESEFSPNRLQILMEKGKNYFVRQYIKLGVFVGGADLEVVEADKAKESISKLALAQSGNCSRALSTPSESEASETL